MAASFVIAGAGSAGAALAARLTEDPGTRVLLLEAGPGYLPPRTTPAELLDARRVAGTHDWGYTAQPVPGRSSPYQRGKVVGGTSSVNAALAIRGTPPDFAEWVARGCTEWSWQDVLPYFIGLESDADFGGELHGAEGPVPVCRWRDDELTGGQRAFYQACRAAGFADIRDHNNPAAAGIRGAGPLPMNRRGMERVSTARAYLEPAWGRPNLTVRSGCLVDKVRVTGSRAAGVDLVAGRVAETVTADHVILSAGAIGSAAILLRSGIGPAGQLAAMGIKPAIDLPGVGARLRDHPGVSLLLAPRPGSDVAGGPAMQVLARYPGREPGGGGEVFLFLAGGIDVTGDPEIQAMVGGPVAMELCPVLMRPRGAGRLTLRSADPREQPAIELGFDTNPEDLERMKDAVRLARDLARSPEMASVTGGIAGAGQLAADTEDALTAYVRDHVETFGHGLGTAPMGSPGDPGAVVSQHCQVHGIGNLWVVDASVMPAVPAVPPNLTTIMIAERAATWLAGA